MKQESEEHRHPPRQPDPNNHAGSRLTLQPRIISLVAGPVVILIAAATMAWWTWGTWADVLVDFGQQLYLPWQIAEGRVLYADLAYYNGPLSQYVNTLAFKLFGVGLHTMVVLNLFWMGLLVGLLHHAVRLVGGRLSAVVACLVFVLLFAFGHYVGISNYNYVCPYTHEMTHGLILSLASMVCVWHSVRFGSWMLGAAGLLLGLAFLTKAEVFVAGVAGTITALILTIPGRSSEGSQILKEAGCFFTGFLIPPLLAYLLLCLGMPADRAFAGTMGSWMAVANTELTNLEFFRKGVGLTDIRGNLFVMVACVGWYAATIVPVALLSLAARRSARREVLMTGVTLVALTVTLWAFWDDIAWRKAARGLLPALLFLGVTLTVRFARVRDDVGQRERLIRQISMIVFALAMLGKMALNARIYHYGFVFVMPGTLVMVVALVGWIPSALRHYGGSVVVFRAGAFVLLGSIVFAYLSIQGQIMAGKDRWVVGPAGDALRADPLRGELVNKVLEAFPQLMKEEQTLAVLPEGVVLNFLLRRPNPTPFTNFMPTEVVFFGEARMLAAFEAHPPDWIMLVHKDTSEFGFRFFGQDYGQALFAWIMEAYQPVVLAGAMPLQSHRYGILLMVRKEQSDP